MAAGGLIERGPGRHGVSNAFFVYLRDPDGHRIELYACDYYTGDPDLKPLPPASNRAGETTGYYAGARQHGCAACTGGQPSGGN